MRLPPHPSEMQQQHPSFQPPAQRLSSSFALAAPSVSLDWPRKTTEQAAAEIEADIAWLLDEQALFVDVSTLVSVCRRQCVQCASWAQSEAGW